MVVSVVVCVVDLVGVSVRISVGGVFTVKKATVAAGFHASSLGDMTWDERLCSHSVEWSRPHVSSHTCHGQISKKLPNG